jgi:RNA polymerase sigma-70 factor (ECF subfamily)
MTKVVLKELTARVALNDDGAAYKKLFLLYHPRLLSFSYSITQCKESSEEAVSDVFLNIWKGRKTLLQLENFHLYLYICTKNISLNYLAKQKRARVFSLDQTKTEFKSIYFDPEQLMITAEMFKRIQAAIQELPPKCQLIFKLIKEDELSYKEAAELLHLSVKTIEAQMTIALRKLGTSIYFRQPSLS